MIDIYCPATPELLADLKVKGIQPWISKDGRFCSWIQEGNDSVVIGKTVAVWDFESNTLKPVESRTGS